MRESLKNSISETIQDLMNAGLTTTFTNKELKTLGVNKPEVKVTAEDLKNKRINQQVTNR